MSPDASPATEPPGIYDALELGYDVMDGLTRPFKELSSRFLYDERGSSIFKEILELPEYYQGRTEVEILRREAARIIEQCAPQEVVDIGAGSGEKGSILLGAAEISSLTYVPVDLSSEMLRVCEEQMRQAFPNLSIRPVEGDITRLTDVLPAATEGRLIVMFGGTVGNLLLGTRRRFMREIAQALGPGGHVLLGIDLLKEPELIEAAYDDGDGVTAAFNLNLLAMLNSRLGANFDLGAFDHVIVFDEVKSWVEMRLRARRHCSVRFEALDWQVDFAPGEEIRTEVSAKFSKESFSDELRANGLVIAEWLTDDAERFALPLVTHAA